MEIFLIDPIRNISIKVYYIIKSVLRGTCPMFLLQWNIKYEHNRYCFQCLILLEIGYYCYDI